MADKVVSIQFNGDGIGQLTNDVKALAAAVGSVPAKVSVRGSGRAGAQGVGSLLPAMPGVMPPAIPGGAATSAGSQVRVFVSAVAQAQSVAAGSVPAIAGLVGSLAKIHPVAALAAVAIGALAFELSQGLSIVQSAQNSSLMYGNAGMNAHRGTFRAVGISNPGSTAEALSDAIANNPVARAYAMKAGINPNNNIFGGDLNSPQKLYDTLSRFGDPHKMSDRDAMIFNRSTNNVVGDQIATLRNASDDVRKEALNAYAASISPEALQRAADAQLKWNMLMGKFADVAVSTFSVVGPVIDKILDAAKWFMDHTNPFGGDDKEKSAADKNKMAADKMNTAADKFSQAVEGIFGGGRRTQNGALPQGWGYNQYAQEATRRGAHYRVL